MQQQVRLFYMFECYVTSDVLKTRRFTTAELRPVMGVGFAIDCVRESYPIQQTYILSDLQRATNGRYGAPHTRLM